MGINASKVQQLYIAYFNRPADPRGLAAWEKALDDKASVETIAKGFSDAPEFKKAYDGKSTVDYVIALYQNLFNRVPDKDGLLFWADMVDSKKIAKEQLPLVILTNTGKDDAAVVANKIEAATAFSTAVDTAEKIQAYQTSNDQALASARAFLSAVTGDAATKDAAVKGAAATVSALLVGNNGATAETVLRTTQDTLSGTAGNDFFRGVAGVDVGSQDQTTLNSSDIIDGGAGDDQLIVNLTGPQYRGGATIKNIETLKLGTNLAASAFDYNVNQGVNEITGVNKVVADQINNGETLTIQNLTATASNGKEIPVLSWENEANSVAGIVNVNYRQSAVEGSSTVQKVVLQNVTTNGTDTNGQLNIAAGVETLDITSTGTSTAGNTLVNSTNVPTNGPAADLTSGTGSLTKVVIHGATQFGRVTSSSAIDGEGKIAAANLVSYAHTVTEVDASDTTGNVNSRFTAKTDGTATNVKFTGGKGNDYTEFALGNVNAAGGDGNDTFAFVTTALGASNSTFGAGDTLVGGAGNDTIRLGTEDTTTVFQLASTEFEDKKGIDVLDIRGRVNTAGNDQYNNNIALSSSIVANADTANKFNVKTDGLTKGQNGLVTTLNLESLGANQGIQFDGGTGSDRIVVNNASFNGFQTLKGGGNAGNVANAAATDGDYDTITVVNGAVIDRTDLSGVSGFEGIVLVKNTTGINNFKIDLTEAFVLANTNSVNLDNATVTNIDDRVFQIGTANGANGKALTAGDTVRIDVTDLFDTSTNTLKTSLSARQIDVRTLTDAGVTVAYDYNGTQYASLAALTAAVAAVGGSTVLAGNDAAGRTSVVGASVAIPQPNLGVNYTSNAVGAQSTLGTNNNDTFTLTQADTVSGGTGSDIVTFNTGSTAAQVTLGGGTDTANVNVVPAAGFVLKLDAGGTVNVAADFGAAFDMNGVANNFQFGAATKVSFTASQTGVTLENGATTSAEASAGGVFTLGTGGQTIAVSGTANYTVTESTGADTITVTSTGTTGITVTQAAANGADTFNLNAGTVTVTYAAATGNLPNISGATNADTINGFTAGVDVLRFIDVAGSGIDLAGTATKTFLSGTAAVVGAQMLDATNLNIAVVTGQGYASYAAAEAALKAAGATEAQGQVIVFFNTTTNTAQVVFDTDGVNAAGNGNLIATLAGVDLAGLANLTTANFAVA